MNTAINFIKAHKLVTFMVLLLLIIGIPVTLFQLNKNQENRSRAGGGSVAVILTPLTSTLAIGEDAGIQVTVDGAGHDISAVDITLTYDPALFAPFTTCPPATNPPMGMPCTVNNPFSPAATFATITNASDRTIGTIHFVGVNPTSNPITSASIPLGTIHLQALAVGTAQVGFANIHINGAGVSGALPVDATATKIGTYTITEGTTISPTPMACGGNITNPPVCPTGYTCVHPSSSPGDTSGTCVLDTPVSIVPSPPCPLVQLPNGTVTNQCPSPTAAITPITTPGAGANISLKLSLPGIGAGAGGNNTPKQPTRTATVTLFDSNGQAVSTQSAGVSYENGVYHGMVPMGTLSAGSYEAKVRMGNTLWRRVPGIIAVSGGTEVINTPSIDLIPGDLSRKNTIDLLDYNAVVACYQGTCPNDTKVQADFNDDGVVDLKDLNILLRAFANHQGD